MGLFGGSGSADRMAKRAEERELAKQARIKQGTKDVRSMFRLQFDDSFYDKFKTDYRAYYEPQRDKQFLEQGKQLDFQLARQGLTNSSVKTDKFADLNEQMKLNRINLTSTANELANSRKTEVQRAQEGIISQLHQSGDAAGAAADAAAMSLQGTRENPYEPLGQVFTDATAGLATQADLERRGTSRYKTGLFSGPTSSSSGATIN